MKDITLTLPFPPSVNGYWRAIARGKSVAQIISAKGRAYRGQVQLAVRLHRIAPAPRTGRLGVTVWLSPPDRRRRDLDNYTKALLDGLTHAGVWVDDEQIDDLRVVRCAVMADGQAVVEIREVMP